LFTHNKTTPHATNPTTEQARVPAKYIFLRGSVLNSRLFTQIQWGQSTSWSGHQAAALQVSSQFKPAP